MGSEGKLCSKSIYGGQGKLSSVGQGKYSFVGQGKYSSGGHGKYSSVGQDMYRFAICCTRLGCTAHQTVDAYTTGCH